MQSHDSSRFRSPDPRSQPPHVPAWDVAATAPAAAGLAPELPFAESRVVVAAPALLVEASFRGVPLCSRLLRADEPKRFTIGAARGADAPVNPAYLSASTAPADAGGHALVEPMSMGGGFGGFAVNLAPAMLVELQTPVQVMTLRPDFGHAEAPLALPADARLHVLCGEVAFDIYAAEPAADVPRPRFGADLREGGRYTLGVGLAFLALLLIVRAIPEDPSSLSGDDLGRMRRMLPTVTIPLEVNSPEIDSQMKDKVPGGGGAAAAKGQPGQAGDKHAPKVAARRAVAGQVAPKDAKEAAGEVRKNTLLAVLDGPMSGSAAEVFEHGEALGPDKETVVGNLMGTTTANAYGAGGLSMLGSGSGGGGTGEHTIGLGGLNTMGRFGAGTGTGTRYGAGAGTLGHHKAIVPDPILGTASVRGSLDKDIIRRIVRRHLNEVKYCYDQALTRNPKLDGRMVAQFTISPTGRVLASVVQSSTLGSPTVEMCVANAIKRWEFPAPERGGLAIVSYPFSFAPAGN
jgi:TonB family protein